MMYELKHFVIRMAVVLIMAPFIGWLMLRFIEKFGEDWKSGNRRKRWVILSSVFIFLAGIGGWLR